MEGVYLYLAGPLSPQYQLCQLSRLSLEPHRIKSKMWVQREFRKTTNNVGTACRRASLLYLKFKLHCASAFSPQLSHLPQNPPTCLHPKE